MEFVVKIRFIDLNLEFTQSHTSVTFLRKELMDELRQNNLCSTDGLCSRVRISLLCRALPRQLQNQELFLLGSVSHLGLCSIDVSREPQRYRGVSASGAHQALPYGHSQSDFAEHFGQCQSDSRLENLCRFCPCAYPISARPLPRGALRTRTQLNGLRAGCHHHRPLPLAFSLGAVSPKKIGCQTAHFIGSARQHSYSDHHHRRTDSRSQYPRPALLGSGCHLPDGSRVSRFSKTLPFASVRCLLC